MPELTAGPLALITTPDVEATIQFAAQVFDAVAVDRATAPTVDLAWLMLGINHVVPVARVGEDGTPGGVHVSVEAGEVAEVVEAATSAGARVASANAQSVIITDPQGVVWWVTEADADHGLTEAMRPR